MGSAFLFTPVRRGGAGGRPVRRPAGHGGDSNPGGALAGDPPAGTTPADGLR